MSVCRLLGPGGYLDSQTTETQFFGYSLSSLDSPVGSPPHKKICMQLSSPSIKLENELSKDVPVKEEPQTPKNTNRDTANDPARVSNMNTKEATERDEEAVRIRGAADFNVDGRTGVCEVVDGELIRKIDSVMRRVRNLCEEVSDIEGDANHARNRVTDLESEAQRKRCELKKVEEEALYLRNTINSLEKEAQLGRDDVQRLDEGLSFARRDLYSLEMESIALISSQFGHLKVRLSSSLTYFLESVPTEGPQYRHYLGTIMTAKIP